MLHSNHLGSWSSIVMLSQVTLCPSLSVQMCFETSAGVVLGWWCSWKHGFRAPSVSPVYTLLHLLSPSLHISTYIYIYTAYWASYVLLLVFAHCGTEKLPDGACGLDAHLYTVAVAVAWNLVASAVSISTCNAAYWASYVLLLVFAHCGTEKLPDGACGLDTHLYTVAVAVCLKSSMCKLQMTGRHSRSHSGTMHCW